MNECSGALESDLLQALERLSYTWSEKERLLPAYVPGHKNDIFVSYARVDNTPIRGIDLGWVSHLVDTLDNILSQALGRSDLFELWMDTRRDSPAVRLTSDILDHVRQSATLLVILSPGYLASEWCRDELSCFVDTINADLQGSLRQIFVALRHHLGRV